jgi:hypothetical protein
MFVVVMIVTIRSTINMRSEVLTAEKMSIMVFWVITPYGLVGGYQCCGGTLTS